MTSDRSTPTLAEQMTLLLSLRRRPDGTSFSWHEVCALLHAEQGVRIDPSYLRRLQSGEKVNPTRNILSQLCRFFRVSPTFFFPECLDADGPSPRALIQEGMQRMGHPLVLQQYVLQLLETMPIPPTATPPTDAQ